MRKCSIISSNTRTPSFPSFSSVILVTLACIFLAAFIYSTIARPLVEQYFNSAANYLPKIPGGLIIKTLLVMLFSIFHAAYALGWRRTLAFFALAAAISWAYEQLGVETGLVYGKYHYTNALGPRLGHVPLIIPIAWFMMIYPSYIIANLVIKGRFVTAQRKERIQAKKKTSTTFRSQPAADAAGSAAKAARFPVKPLQNNVKSKETVVDCTEEKKKQNIVNILWLSLAGALVMTAWDFVVDPYLSGPNQLAWVWEEGGSSPYFGVPLQNFGGWILTTFTIYIVYRVLENRISDGGPRRMSIVVSIGITDNSAPSPPLSAPVNTGTRYSSVPAFVIAMPVLVYGAMMVSNVIPREPPSLIYIGPLIMGVPMILATIRLWHLKKQRHIDAAASNMPVKVS